MGLIKRIEEVLAYKNQFITVFDDKVEYVDGEPGNYVRICPSDGLPGVVIIPHAQGKLGIIRVFRYPVGAWQWGFPRGFAHSADPLVTARIELEEELGMMECELSLLGWFTPDSGLMESHVAVVLAEARSLSSSPSDTQEVDKVTWLSLTALQSELGKGEYDDGMTMAALTLATAAGIKLT